MHKYKNKVVSTATSLEFRYILLACYHPSVATWQSVKLMDRLSGLADWLCKYTFYQLPRGTASLMQCRHWNVADWIQLVNQLWSLVPQPSVRGSHRLVWMAERFQPFFLSEKYMLMSHYIQSPRSPVCSL